MTKPIATTESKRAASAATQAAGAAALAATAAAVAAATAAEKAAAAAAEVLAVAATLATKNAVRVEASDHDGLIRVQGALESLTAVVATNAASILAELGEVKADVRTINGGVVRVTERTGRIEDELEGRATLLQQNRELWADFQRRRESKGERQWLAPIIVSIPSSVLATVAIVLLLFGTHAK